MIECTGGHIKIEGNVLDINEDLGTIIMHVFKYAETLNADQIEPAKKMYEAMILRTLILARCSADPMLIMKYMLDENGNLSFSVVD